MAIPRWKKHEQDVQDFFEEKKRRNPLIYHRFYDTGSTGGDSFLPNQPADHLVIYNGNPVLIETKSSERHDSMAANFSGLVSNKQIAHHVMWNRAKATTLFLFLNPDGHYELWDGDYCCYCRLNSKKLNRSMVILLVDTLEAALTDVILNKQTAFGSFQSVHVFPKWR